MEEIQSVLDEGHMIDFIFDSLVSQGIIVTREDIGTILNLEMKYMVDKGFAYVVDGEEDVTIDNSLRNREDK